MLFCTGGPDSLTASGPPRAMWVWDAQIPRTKTSSRDLFKFCREQNIDTLFISTYRITKPVEVYMRRFNREAHRNGIRVHALAGDPRWGLERYHHIAIKWAEAVIGFNSRVKPGERFDGLHSDIEPYLAGKVWEDDKQGVLTQYLDLVEAVKARIDAGDKELVFACDIPFWFDDDRECHIPRGRFIKPTSFHMLDIVDEIAIMDYRNFTAGDNGSIALARYEVGYANETGKKVYIGQETQEGMNPEYISFAGEGNDYMEKCFAEIESHYAHEASFAGIAIHHYVSYKKFLKKSKGIRTSTRYGQSTGRYGQSTKRYTGE